MLRPAALLLAAVLHASAEAEGAIDLWDSLQEEGYYITPIGGSDDHHPQVRRWSERRHYRKHRRGLFGIHFGEPFEHFGER